MRYEEYCNWYELHGNPAQDDLDYEIAARHDSINERGYDRDIAGESERYEDYAGEPEQCDSVVAALDPSDW